MAHHWIPGTFPGIRWNLLPRHLGQHRGCWILHFLWCDIPLDQIWVTGPKMVPGLRLHNWNLFSFLGRCLEAISRSAGNEQLIHFTSALHATPKQPLLCYHESLILAHYFVSFSIVIGASIPATWSSPLVELKLIVPSVEAQLPSQAEPLTSVLWWPSAHFWRFIQQADCLILCKYLTSNMVIPEGHA